MSGTLLAYGDKVIGVVARDNGSVSITADGVKTYSQLFDSLYALVDGNKITERSLLKIGEQIYQCSNKSASRMDFGSITVRNMNGIRLKASSSEFSAYNFPTNTYTDSANSVPSASTVFKIIY